MKKLFYYCAGIAAILFSTRALAAATLTLTLTCTGLITNMSCTTGSGPGSTYSGVADQETTVNHFWGLQAASLAKATAGTTLAADLCNATGCTGANLCTGVKILSTGYLDTSSGLYCNGNTQTVTTWCSTSCVYGGVARIINLYDQIGSVNLTQSTYANAPYFILSGVNSKPMGACSTAATQTMITGTITGGINPPLSIGLSFAQFTNYTNNENFEVGNTAVLVGNYNSSGNASANTIGGEAAGGAPWASTTVTNATGTTDFSAAHMHSALFVVNSSSLESLFADGAAPVTGAITYNEGTGTTINFCDQVSDIFFGKFWTDSSAVTTTVGENATNSALVPLP